MKRHFLSDDDFMLIESRSSWDWGRLYLDETEYRTAMNRLWSAFGCGGINGLGDAFKQKNVKLDRGTRLKVCQDYFCREHVAGIASLRQ